MALTIIGGKDAHGLKDLGEFMADRIEFDREAVGVSAKTDWHDADFRVDWCSLPFFP